jgi:DNA-binding NarL/FixJ family response regulator
MEKAIRVLVANRPRLLRELILSTFADQPDIEIVGELSEESEIFASVDKTSPNFVVIGLDSRAEDLRFATSCSVNIRRSG